MYVLKLGSLYVYNNLIAIDETNVEFTIGNKMQRAHFYNSLSEISNLDFLKKNGIVVYKVTVTQSEVQ